MFKNWFSCFPILFFCVATSQKWLLARPPLWTAIESVNFKDFVQRAGTATIEWFSKKTGRHFRTGKRADNLDTTLLRLPVLALPFSPSSSGRHFAGFPVVIKTPRICVNCALINEIMLFGMISELISRITRFLSLFYLVNLWKFTATFILDSRKEARSSASDLRF